MLLNTMKKKITIQQHSSRFTPVNDISEFSADKPKREMFLVAQIRERPAKQLWRQR